MRAIRFGSLLTIAAGFAAAQEAPSFDCARAASEAEALVCTTPELARLDRELARLYALAEGGGPDMTDERRNELVATQRGWIKGRDDCWKADDRPACVKREYVIRIAELRQGYADARAEDASGISLGPFATVCDGLAAGIGTTFINSDPGAVHLAWLDGVVVLDHVVSGSGARYEATLPAGRYQFWNKGDAASFEAPGVDGALDCAVEEIG